MKPLNMYLLIFFSIFCIATSSIIIRYSNSPAMVIALYRVVFTSILAGMLGGPRLFANLKAISRCDYFYILVSGIFLALHFAFWISSLNYTSIPSSVLFTNLQVIFVLLFSILFLKEKVNAWVTGGILLAILGSALIGGGDLASGRFYGDMLALASGLFIAIYFILGRQVRSRVDAWPYTCAVSVVAVLVLWPAAASFNLPLSGFEIREWVLFFLLALGPGIAGHGVLNWTLKYVKAPVVSVSILGESVGASILAYIFFRELLLWYQIIGGIFILAGIYMAASNEAKSQLPAN